MMSHQVVKVGATLVRPMADRKMSQQSSGGFVADFKTSEQLNWTLNANVVGGLEFARAGALRRFRILANYYHGNNPSGQFYGQKVESIGLGLYLSF